MIHWRSLEWRAKRSYKRINCVTLSVDHPTLRQPAAQRSGEKEERLRRTRKWEWWLLFLWGQCLSEYSSHPSRPSEETRFSSLFSAAPEKEHSLRTLEKNWSQWVGVYSRWTLVEEERPWWDSSRRRGIVPLFLRITHFSLHYLKELLLLVTREAPTEIPHHE